jgi:replicative DNA helicase
MQHRDVVAQLERDLESAYTRQSPVFGMPTSIPAIDKRTGGLHPGEMTLLGARPSNGKTALAGQIAYDLAHYAYQNDLPGQVLFFSAEMPARRILQREVARQTGVSIQRQMAGDYDRAERERIYATLQAVSPLPIEIDDKAQISAEYIKDRAQTHHRGDGLLLLVVDHLQIASSGAGQSQYKAVTDTVHALRALRDVVDAPILVLSQLRRPDSDAPTNRPHSTDLRDSGAVEEAANNVWLLHNPVPTGDSGCGEMREAELIIAKARDGWTGTIPLEFDPEKVSFQDLTPAPIHLELEGVVV